MNEEWEAERALVHAHGTWKMLPLHPQPQWLESWSSYLIRLAEANGLKAINELATLAGLRGRWKGVRASPDSYFAVSGFPAGGDYGMYAIHPARHHLLSSGPPLCLSPAAREPIFSGKPGRVFALLSSLFSWAADSLLPSFLAVSRAVGLPHAWVSFPECLRALWDADPLSSVRSPARTLLSMPGRFENLPNVAPAAAGTGPALHTDKRPRDAADDCRVGPRNYRGTRNGRVLHPVAAQQTADHTGSCLPAEPR